jgi:MerR family transcriptional regulator, copper efflux regulator
VKIGELAMASGFNTRTIRYYENIGLLPEPERLPNGYRRYRKTAVDRLGFIRDARSAGLSLAEIGMILDMKDHGESTCDHVVFLLEEHVRSVDRQIEDLGRARGRLEDLIDRARRMDPSGCLDPNRCQTLTPDFSLLAGGPIEHSEKMEAASTTRQPKGTNMNKSKLIVPEIHCGHCKTSLEGAVGAMPGVADVDVSIEDATIDVTYDNTVGLEAIKSVIEEQGYAVAG